MNRGEYQKHSKINCKRGFRRNLLGRCINANCEHPPYCGDYILGSREVKSYVEFGYNLPPPPPMPPPGSEYSGELGDFKVYRLLTRSNRKLAGSLFYIKNNRRVYSGSWSKAQLKEWTTI